MNILDTIVEHKRTEIAARRRNTPPSQLRETEHYSSQRYSLSNAINNAVPFAIIAEVKRASPTAGVLKSDLNPVSLAREYQDAGAVAISCLTDERFFQGSLQDLRSVREAVPMPILRKDFILDEYQLLEARGYGADAVLLIAAILERTQLHELHAAAVEYGLEPLVELYHEREIDILDFSTMKLIGVNNRDLKTFSVDVGRSIRIASHLPDDVCVVSESGLTSAADLRHLKNHGIRAALIGEHLVKADRPGHELRHLLGELSDASEG